MPLPSSRMTKQPVRPARYYPGKAVAEDPVSEEESDEEDERDDEQEAAPKAPAPKFQSFPRKPASDASKAAVAPKTANSNAQDDLEGFVTASESSDDEEDGSGEEEEDSSEEEESSSDDEPKRPMLAPKFVSKAKRAQQQETITVSEERKAEEEERKRREKADEMLQMQIERDAAARAAGKKSWDEDDAPNEEVDDRDDLDPEAEKAAWKLRELKRVKRDRQALIAKEQEREEVERRRNMTAEEREQEDREFLEKQAEDKEDRGKMNYMQKYFHKGAFFGGDDQDEEVKAALNRDIAGRKFVDEAGDKSVLPEYMKIRDATRLGKKGRTRYKDLKSEDTGSWGRFENKKRDYDDLDDRFKPDERGGGREQTGANSAPLGERRRREDESGRDEKRPRYD